MISIASRLLISLTGSPLTRGISALPAIYVDSVAGSDSNDGLSASAPKLTLAAAKTAATGAGLARFSLKRGSTWRESFGLVGFTAPSVSSYGTTGAPPIIDGADIITGWTTYLTGGFLNMYQKSVANEAGATGRLVVFENGAALTRVTSDSACASLPGSFVDPFSGGTANPVNLRIHPFGNTNPNTDGKTYEVNVRAVVFQGPSNSTITGIQTQRANNNNGSADLVSTYNGNASSGLAVWGTKHNGGIGSGVMRDYISCFADGASSAETGRIPFVAFLPALPEGNTEVALFERCGVLGPAGGPAFYSHSTGAFSYSAVNGVQLWVIDTNDFTGAFSNLTGGYFRNVNSPPVQAGVVSKIMVSLIRNGAVVPLGDVGFPTTLTDSVFYALKRSNNTEVMRPQGPGTITNCAFFAQLPVLNGTENVNWFVNASANQATTMTYSIMFNGANLMQVNAGTYTGHHNIYISSNGWNMADKVNFQHSSGYKNTLSAWQSSTGQDSNSVYVERTDQAAGNANALWLAWSQAAGGTNLETIGPAVGDWRINPGARVYSGANVAYTGTFPDGVPLTNAGPQTRWDWNARASASGPPIRLPAVPVTLQECQTYILNPPAWNFYP